MMNNFNELVAINHNLNWCYIPDHRYRTLIIDGSGSGKTYILLILIKHQRPDLDIIYLYIKVPFQPKYQLLINERQKVGIKHQQNPNRFVDYSQKIMMSMKI